MGKKNIKTYKITYMPYKKEKVIKASDINKIFEGRWIHQVANMDKGASIFHYKGFYIKRST